MTQPKGPPSQDKPPKPKGQAKAPDLEAAAAAAQAQASGLGATPPPKDDPPAATPRKRKRSKQATTKAIADALAELLSMPAVPCAIMGDQWAAQHFSTQGREFAEKIAQVSERNDVLRSWCERALEGESVAVLLIGSIMYAYPPLLHWGIVPGPAGLFGVPAKAPKPSRVFVPPPPADRPPPESLPIEPTVVIPPEGSNGGPVGEVLADDLADLGGELLDEPPAIGGQP